jgi:hypothetical protein
MMIVVIVQLWEEVVENRTDIRQQLVRITIIKRKQDQQISSIPTLDR